MKRLIVLLIILLIPINVFAETCDPSGITIQSIEMIEKSNGSKEITKATISETQINLDISLTNEKDNIKYKLTIKNNTDVDYVLDESMFKKNYDNISYIFETDNKTLKAGATKDIVLSVELTKNPGRGVFNETNTFNLDLTGGKIVNPPTGVKSLLYIVPVLLIMGFVIIFTSKRKTAFKTMAIIVGLLILVPTIVRAVCKCNLKINATVTVDNCIYKLVTDRGTFEKGKDVKEMCLSYTDVASGKDYDYNYLALSYAHPTGDNKYAYISISNKKEYDGEPFFNDNSYVKIYSDSLKTNIIKTITKAELHEHHYNIEAGSFCDSKYEALIGEYNELYYTVSLDLMDKIDIKFYYSKPDWFWHASSDAPVIINEDVLNKIMVLKNSNTSDRLLRFTNCSRRTNSETSAVNHEPKGHEYESITTPIDYEPTLEFTLASDKDLICEGNIYHAVWDAMSFG